MFDEDPGISPALPAWIADDLTLVTRRKNALYLIDYILQIAPKSRFKVSLLNSEVLMSGPDDDGVRALCSDIRERGMVARHVASIASVEQLNGKNVGILHHIRCKARPIKNAQPQLLATLQHKISWQPEDSTL